MGQNQFSSVSVDRALSLSDALTSLEDGSAFVGMTVDLGQDRTVSLDNLADAPGFTQRLRGHRMLMAVATGQVSLPVRPQQGLPDVCPRAKALLDAVARTG